MHTDDQFRASGLGRDATDRNGGGIGGQNGPGRTDLIQIPEYPEFKVFPLGGRFHDKIRVGHVLQVGAGLDAAHDHLFFFGGHTTLGDTALKVGGDRVHALFDKGVLDVAHDHG